MMLRSLIFLLLWSNWITHLQCQAQAILLNPGVIDFGTVEQAGSLRAEVIVENQGKTRLFLMRAEAPPAYEVFVSKKNIPPGDTALLRITYHPAVPGPFSTTLNILHNQSERPLSIPLKGRLNSLLPDVLTNCVSFSPKTGSTAPLVPVNATFRAYFSDAKTGEKINEASILFISKNGNRKQEFTTSTAFLKTEIPLGPYALVISAPGYETQMTEQYINLVSATQTFLLTRNPEKPLPPRDSIQKEVPVPTPLAENPDQLDPALYKPNNVVFLIDLSGSMKAPNKLPLLKKSIAQLLKPIRPVDKISIVTYAETVQVLLPPTTGADKAAILKQLDSLRAGGLTAGSEGLERAYNLAAESWIDGGNNQVILATDGVFRVNKKDRKRIALAGQNQTPILSVAAFGTDEKALQMLQNLSNEGKGSFMKIDSGDDATQILLDEIRKRSRK